MTWRTKLTVKKRMYYEAEDVKPPERPNRIWKEVTQNWQRLMEIQGRRSETVSRRIWWVLAYLEVSRIGGGGHTKTHHILLKSIPLYLPWFSIILHQSPMSHSVWPKWHHPYVHVQTISIYLHWQPNKMFLSQELSNLYLFSFLSMKTRHPAQHGYPLTMDWP